MRLLASVRYLWDELTIDPAALASERVQPLLAGLAALRQHIDRRLWQRLAQDLWTEAEHAQRRPIYNDTEAHGLELVACALASLADLGRNRVADTAYCGTPQAKHVDEALPSVARRQVGC